MLAVIQTYYHAFRSFCNFYEESFLSSSVWAALTESHRLPRKQQECISPSSGGWGVQDQALADLASGRGTRPGSQMAIFSLCPQVAEGVGEFSGVSFICKDTHPIHKGFTLMI